MKNIKYKLYLILINIMSVFPSSAMGLPDSLKYYLPPSLPDSARAYTVNIAPDGITSVSLTG